MQARHTDKVLFPLVVLYFKTLGLTGQKVAAMEGSVKNLILNGRSSCWEF